MFPSATDLPKKPRLKIYFSQFQHLNLFFSDFEDETELIVKNK